MEETLKQLHVWYKLENADELQRASILENYFQHIRKVWTNNIVLTGEVMSKEWIEDILGFQRCVDRIAKLFEKVFKNHSLFETSNMNRWWISPLTIKDRFYLFGTTQIEFMLLSISTLLDSSKTEIPGRGGRAETPTSISASRKEGVEKPPPKTRNSEE